MEIMEIKENQHIKIGKTSITVREDGKTKGVVKGIYTWETLPNNRKSDLFHLLKKANIWGTKHTQNIVVDGKDIYLFYNRKIVEFYEQYGKAVPEEAERKAKEFVEISNRCQQNNISLIIRYIDC